MRAHLEPLSAVIRVGGAYGEPYTWCATVRYLAPDEVELVGAMRAPKPSEWRAMATVFRQTGVRIVWFERHHGDQIDRHRVELWTPGGQTRPRRVKE
jgi:hypothetical protein